MQRAFLLIIAFMAFVPFIFLPSSGHDILIQPFNIFLWEVVALGLFFAGLYAYKHQSIGTSRPAAALLVLPLALLISSSMAGMPYPVDTSIRVLAIVGMLAFMHSLFQFRVSRRTFETALFILLIGMTLNAIEAILQMLPGRILNGLIPHPPVPRPLGFSMQPNLLASMLATGLIISLHLLFSPGFKGRSVSLKSVSYIATFLFPLVILATGSRLGLLAIAASLAIFSISRLRLLRHQTTRTLTIVILITAGAVAGAFSGDGLDKTLGKMERLATGNSDVRPYVYGIAWDTFLEQPLSGYGVGSFPGHFQYNAADYMADNPELPFAFKSHFSHPHNEILMWAVEGGVIALAGLGIAACIIMRRLYLNGRQRGGTQLALLLPISLHMMVELPFYISVYHQMLFVFLLYWVFASTVNYRQVSRAAATAALMLSTLIFTAALYSLTQTFKASRQLSSFLYYKEVDINALDQASTNYYFAEMGTFLTLKTLLNQSLMQQNTQWIKPFIVWTENYIQKIPDSSAFHDLALAYAALGEYAKAEDAIQRGLYLYPGHEEILSARGKVANIKTNGGVWVEPAASGAEAAAASTTSN